MTFGAFEGYLFHFTGDINNKYSDQGKLKANGVDIKCAGPSSCDLVDWNNDGLYDLLAAPRGVKLYINSGTKESYSFTNFTSLKTNTGVAIECAYEGFIHVGDLYNDGLPDLFVTNKDDGSVKYYENIGTIDSPQLKYVGYCQSNGVDIKTNSSTRVWITDWNEDGTNDMLLGTYSGNNLFLYIGIPDGSVNIANKNLGKILSYEPRLVTSGNSHSINFSNVNTGECNIINTKGQTVYSFSLNENQNSYVLPEKIRTGYYVFQIIVHGKRNYKGIYLISN